MTDLSQLPQDRYLKIDTVNVRYWEAGNEGKPVILLHGAGSCVEIWSFNIRELAKHYRVYAFDMVGTGLSDKPNTSYSVNYQAEFLQRFMDALELNRASLIGNSMGGSIALKFALKFSERVDKLVLVSSFGLGKEIDFSDRLLAAFPAIVNFVPPSRRGVRLVLNSCVYDSKLLPKEWVEQSYQFFKLPDARKALISLIKNNLNFWGVRPEVFEPIVNRLNRIVAPTLIFWGKQDKILPVDHAYLAEAKISNVKLCVFDRCGHWAQAEHPQRFNQLTQDFLSK